MDESTASQIELSSVLDSFTYLDNDVISLNGSTLDEIIDELDRAYSDEKPADIPDEYRHIKAAVAAHPEWGKVELVDRSSTNATEASWTDDLIQACTFRDSEGNYYVAYRGTGDGRWCDNGRGMTAPSTQMQQAAADYFDKVAKEYLLEAKANGKTVTVTGHSKGGNEAQYVYMAATHEGIIDNCYSLDGQGFSKAAVRNFQRKYGDRYDDKIAGMYSICGENDYVHDCGIPVIPKENTYFVETSGEGFYPWHHITFMVGDKDGDDGWEYTGINWKRDKDGNGNIVNGEQGEIGKFVHTLFAKMMELDNEDLDGCALAVMYMVEHIMNGDVESLGNVDATLTDFVDFVAHGVPVLISTLFTTEEGKALLRKFINSIYERYGTGGLVACVGVTCLLLLPVCAFVTSLVIVANVVDFVVDCVNAIISTIKDVATKVVECINKIRSAFDEAVKRIAEWAKKAFNKGYKYTTAHPQIQVNTAKLRVYADRIQAVQRRVNNVDRRLDTLYGQVGLLGLFNLLSADLLTGYSWRLNRCVNYLNDTAADFDRLERELTGAL